MVVILLRAGDVPGKFEPADRPRVDCEKGRHQGGVRVGEIKVERGGAPHVAPPGGEDLHSDGFLGWEEGHDLTEDAVREEADQILAAVIHDRQRARFHVGSGLVLDQDARG